MVVTGMGIITPLGSDLEDFWKRLLAGESGIGPVTRFDIKEYDTRFAGEVKDFRAEDYMDRKDARRADLFVQYAIAAASKAVAQAKIANGNVAQPLRRVHRPGMGGRHLRGPAGPMEKGPSRVSLSSFP